MTHEATRLAACPFCGAGETQIIPKTMWMGGLRPSQPISTTVRHWCLRPEGQPQSHIDIVGRDDESAIEAWNRRAALAQPAPTAEVELPAVSGETERVAFEAAYGAACAKTYTLHADFKAGWDARAQSAAKGDEGAKS